MARTLFVADVGNSSILIGEFDSSLSSPTVVDVPRPTRTETLCAWQPDWNKLKGWVDRKQTVWHIGSVNEPVKQMLTDWLLSSSDATLKDIRHSNLSLPTAVRHVDRLGIDRLAAGVAANQLRHPDHPAIVIDAGSAITIDVVSSRGVFLGGMIAPGLQFSHASLANNTFQLPSVEVDSSTPALVGNDTTSAIQAGVFWMAVAGIDGIIRRLQIELAGPCDIFATGGSIQNVLKLVPHNIRHEPNLVLSGLAMANP